MKKILLTLLLVCVLAGGAFAQKALPRFEDYQVPVYRGATRPPKWIRHIGNVWRDNLGKLVEPPEINFAGKYFIVAHSCGTGCRYYTLTDLSLGRDLKVLGMFTTAEPPPKTRDGQSYLTELFSRPNSKMLVAQYHIELRQSGEECRERVFMFEGVRLKPATRTRRACREF